MMSPPETHNSPFRDAASFEAGIQRVVAARCRHEGKPFAQALPRAGFDFYLPAGLGTMKGPLAVEAKFWKGEHPPVAQWLAQLAHIDFALKIKGVLLITNLNLSPAQEKQFKRLNHKNIILWGAEEVLSEFGPFLEAASDLSPLLARKVIQRKKAPDEWKREREERLSALRDDCSRNAVTLLLGAGVSAEAKLPSWTELLGQLLVTLSGDTESQSLTPVRRNAIIRALSDAGGNSPLIAARMIGTIAEDTGGSFLRALHSSLYDTYQNPPAGGTVSAIGELCGSQLPAPRQVGRVITYNYDDIVENELRSRHISHVSLYQEYRIERPGELPICHVHGFLPKDTTHQDATAVFTEDSYHSLYSEPYQWANLIQLEAFRGTTCIAIGLSLIDPSIRRLLDAATQIRGKGSVPHFAFMRRPSLSFSKVRATKTFSKSAWVNRIADMMDLTFRQLGVNIIWIEEFREIPVILRSLISPNSTST